MDEKGKAGRPIKWPRIRQRYALNKAYGAVCYVVDAGAYGLTDEQIARGVKRNRRTFGTRKEADEHAATLRAKRKAEVEAGKFEAANRAVSLASLTDDQRADVLAAFKVLADTKGTLKSAAEFWKKHSSPINARTCNEVLAELVKACEGANRRPRTVSELREKLGAFCADYGEEPVARITVMDLSNWLDARADRVEIRGEGKKERKVRVRLSPRSRAAYRQALNRLFAFADRRGYREGNPIRAIEKPSVETPPPEVFTVAQARKLLVTAQAKAPAMVPFYAVGLFAGLRTENELRGLDWRLIDLAGRTIEVSAASAKKRRARTVEVHNNLAEWLAPYRQDVGLLHYSRTDHARVVKAAGVSWPRNVMRHSCASYHLAAFNDAGKTALMLGHPAGVDILFRHYRRLVKASDASAYWNIRPGQPAGIIQLNAAAG